jgi:hypothetical protein
VQDARPRFQQDAVALAFERDEKAEGLPVGANSG